MAERRTLTFLIINIIKKIQSHSVFVTYINNNLKKKHATKQRCAPSLAPSYADLGHTHRRKSIRRTKRTFFAHFTDVKMTFIVCPPTSVVSTKYVFSPYIIASSISKARSLFLTGTDVVVQKTDKIHRSFVLIIYCIYYPDTILRSGVRTQIKN